jgi:ribosomal protein S18 acetylase RimI-like enzyme
MQPSIRIFREADTDAVVALWMHTFPEYRDPAKAHRNPHLTIANKLATQPELFFVATLEERVIGTIMAGYDGHRGWIYSLAVADESRGHRYGEALVAHAERALAALGCPKVNLQILASKDHLRAYYEKLGYGVDEVVSLGKRLSAA